MVRWLMLTVGVLLAAGSAPIGLLIKQPPSSIREPLPHPWGEAWALLTFVGALLIIIGTLWPRRAHVAELAGAGLTGGMLVVYALALASWGGLWSVSFNTATTLALAAGLLARWGRMVQVLWHQGRKERIRERAV